MYRLKGNFSIRSLHSMVTNRQDKRKKEDLKLKWNIAGDNALFLAGDKFFHKP